MSKGKMRIQVSARVRECASARVRECAFTCVRFLRGHSSVWVYADTPHHSNPAIPTSQHVANMNIVFKYLTSCVKLVGIGPQDIVDSSNETLVMGMIW